MNMNERLECIEQGMKDINESITPFRPSEDVSLSDASERAVMLRKHAALLAEWDAVQQETEELQQELKEDKWITVFRTVTEQADGMMSSLEKAVNRCQVCGEMYFCKVSSFSTGLHMASAQEIRRQHVAHIVCQLYSLGEISG